MQRELVVGASDDAFEREADRVAQHVVRSITSNDQGRIQARSFGPGESAAAGGPRQVARIGNGQPIRRTVDGVIQRGKDKNPNTVKKGADKKAADKNAADKNAKQNDKGGKQDNKQGTNQSGKQDKQTGKQKKPVVAVVSHAGKAEKASADLLQLVADAKAARDPVLTRGVTLAKIEEANVSVAATSKTADTAVSNAKLDVDGWKIYGKQIEERRAGILGCSTRIAKEAPGFFAATSIDAELVTMRVAVSTIISRAQGNVDTAATQLRNAIAAADETTAKAAALLAKKAFMAAEREVTNYAGQREIAMAKMDAWKEQADQTDQRMAADLSVAQYRACSTLITKSLEMFTADARGFTQAAVTIFRKHEERTKAVAERDSKQLELVALTKLSDESASLLDAADKHREQCAAEAQAAQVLLDDARTKSKAAKATAALSSAGAIDAATAATAATKNADISAVHASKAPSNFADEMVAGRRADAADARKLAASKQQISERDATTAEQLRGAKAPLKSAATTKHEAAEQAESMRDEAAGTHTTRTEATAGGAKAAEQAATDVTAADTAIVSARTDATQMDAEMNTRTIGIPDAELRAKLRVRFGDVAVDALLAAGVRPQLMSDAADTISSMIASWQLAPTCVFVSHWQGIAGSTAGLLTRFARHFAGEGVWSISKDRAADVLAGRGGEFGWFVHGGAGVANRLLDVGWSTTDVTTVLDEAHGANIPDFQVTTIATVFIDRAVPAGDARKLLQTGVLASFLVDHALSTIDTLLIAEWSADNIVALVKAANAVTVKPTKQQLATFCSLVVTHGVVQADAVKIMEGAKCSATYLVDTAFVASKKVIALGWTKAQVRDFIEAAENKAKLDATQIDRFAELLRVNNTLTAPKALACLTSEGVADWTALLNQVDHFIADGNLGTPSNIGNHAQSTAFDITPEGDSTTLSFDQDRVYHFAQGHTYRHFAFTTANIERDGPGSSMWPRGTTAASLAAKALAAMQTASVQDQARQAIARQGTSENGTFDQQAYGQYTAGVARASNTWARLTQFYPTSTLVVKPVLTAIGCLFLGAVA